MPQNLELKARIPSLPSAARHARALGARKVELLIQKDTYFDVPQGRLKLREIAGRPSELIRYDRADTSGGRYSTYHVVRTDDLRGMMEMLSRFFPIRSVIKKRRILYRYRNARVHLDRVAGLGTFIEFEVEVTRGKRQAQRLFGTLVKAFNINLKKTIPHSYSDL